MSEIIDARDDPWARSTDLINPRRRAVVHGDVVMIEPIPAPVRVLPDDHSIMASALADMERLGREWRDSPRRSKPLPHVAALEERYSKRSPT
jgi:hypothetical protein